MKEYMIIDRMDYYDGPTKLREISRGSLEECREKLASLKNDNYCLEHNQHAGSYMLAAITDYNIPYLSWSDGYVQDWDGCPCPDPKNDEEGQENLVWAEEQALINKCNVPVLDLNNNYGYYTIVDIVN